MHGKPTICYRQPSILLLHFKLIGKFSRLCLWVASIHMLGVIRRLVTLFHVRFLWWGYRHDVSGPSWMPAAQEYSRSFLGMAVGCPTERSAGDHVTVWLGSYLTCNALLTCVTRGGPVFFASQPPRVADAWTSAPKLCYYQTTPALSPDRAFEGGWVEKDARLNEDLE